jgi:hypothetical protein
MKKSYVAGCAVLLTLLVSSFAAAQTQSITGKVTASQIASTGSIGVWEKHLNCHGEADCARTLVRAGGKYVLMTSKGTYELNDQAKAAQFAGQGVTVAGNFDSAKKTVAVADMEPYNSSAVSAGVQ